MTQTSLITCLRLSGWAAIIGSCVQFGVAMVERNQRMIEMGSSAELRASSNAAYVFGFGLQLPIHLTIACLCLVAARVLTHEHQTLKSVFE